MRQAPRALVTALCVLASLAALAAAAQASSGEDGVSPALEQCLRKAFTEAQLEALVLGKAFGATDVRKLAGCGLTAAQAKALFDRVGAKNKDKGSGDGTGKSGGSGDEKAVRPLSAVFGDGTCTGKGGRLTAPVVAPKLVSSIYPYGAMSGAHITPVDHMYFSFPYDKNGTDLPEGTIPITAPAAGSIVQVSKLDSDYRVVLSVSCDLYVVLIHLAKLEGQLASYNSLGRGESTTVSVPVKAGEVIGDDSATPQFDFSVHDQRVTLKGLLNPATYATEGWKVHTVDPSAYWPAAIWKAYAAKSLRLAAPRFGRFDYDVKGTAAGNWFLQGTNGYQGAQAQRSVVKPGDEHGYWDSHLALAWDAVDPAAIIVSIGDYDGCACQFGVAGNRPSPARITPASGTVVYVLQKVEQVGGTPVSAAPDAPRRGYTVRPGGPLIGLLAVRVNRDGTLTVEKLPGVTDPKQFTGFGAKALTYVR